MKDFKTLENEILKGTKDFSNEVPLTSDEQETICKYLEIKPEELKELRMTWNINNTEMLEYSGNFENNSLLKIMSLTQEYFLECLSSCCDLHSIRPKSIWPNVASYKLEYIEENYLMKVKESECQFNVPIHYRLNGWLTSMTFLTLTDITERHHNFIVLNIVDDNEYEDTSNRILEKQYIVFHPSVLKGIYEGIYSSDIKINVNKTLDLCSELRRYLRLIKTEDIINNEDFKNDVNFIMALKGLFGIK